MRIRWASLVKRTNAAGSIAARLRVVSKCAFTRARNKKEGIQVNPERPPHILPPAGLSPPFQPVPFTTNEPQSYVFGGRNHPLHSNSQKLLRTKYTENMEIQNIKLLESVDTGYSGTNFERPAMQELLELVKSYQINCIIVKDFSRFGRNMIQTGYVRPDRTKVEVEKKNEKQRYYSVKIMQESSCLTERRKLIREHSMTEKQ